jgi:hypothetical protein
MNVIFSRLAATFALLAALTGCVVYDPYPYPAPGPSTFDRSWNAALGALADQGVQTTAVDRTNGTITGRKGAINMNARVITQADGRVRVEFNAGGSLSDDPGLPDRVSRAYDARMGR